MLLIKLIFFINLYLVFYYKLKPYIFVDNYGKISYMKKNVQFIFLMLNHTLNMKGIYMLLNF